LTPAPETTGEVHADRTTIAPAVLVSIARQTALAVPGVAGLAPVPGGVNRWFRRGLGDGVRIAVDGGRARVDLYLVFGRESNVRQVGRAVQTDVARAFQEMVGMPVDGVNVHIEDIDFSSPEP
jgi:uncharacterized alkaline shock family protein YloU